MHEFPSADGLRNTRRNPGELLLSWQGIDGRKLEIALHDEHGMSTRVRRRWVAC